MIKLSDDVQLGTLIKNKFGDKYLFSVNRKNFEQLDYQTQFNKEFDKTFDQKDTLYIITGTDSGLMVQHLLKSPPEKGSAYLFIDFPEIIALTKDSYSLDKNKRIIVTTEDRWEEEAKKIGMDIYFMINKIKRIKSFAAQYYYLNEYVFLNQSLQEATDHISWQYQSQLGSKIFVQRQLENLAENHTPALCLKDYFKGKSALILAGGPSLDNYIEWIEENQSHFVVIAVSRIARRLLETKIKPDIFVSVDPHIINYDVSKEIFNFEKESFLVHQYHLSPTLLGNWLGSNLYLGDLFPWETKLNQDNLTGIGPTVTNTAILLAIKMGITEQIFFGVDLCHSSEGFSHAKGSYEHDSGPDINIIGQVVLTNKGDKAETNSAYFEAITTIEELGDLSRQLGGRLINPSPNSAKMKNIEHILIDQININEEQISILPLIQKQKELNTHSKHKINHYISVLKELKHSLHKVDKIRKIANNGIEFNNNFFSGNNPSDNFQFKLKMDKLENDLNSKNLKPFTELSKKFGVNEFLYFINPDSDREWTDEEIKKSGNTYYQALKSGSNELYRHIFTAINRTESRLIEQNKIKINSEMIEHHFCSFDTSYLLDRKIQIQHDISNKELSKQTLNIREKNLQRLNFLLKSKQSTIKICKNLVWTYKNIKTIEKVTKDESKQALAFYMLILQNEENEQTRRLSIFEKGNPELFFLPEHISIMGNSAHYYKMIHRNVNKALYPSPQIKNYVFIQKQLENINSNNIPASILKDYFKNKAPALILSDSASLEEYIEWIEDNQENYVVIAVAELAKRLVNTKIKPDFFILTEPSPSNVDIYHNVKSLLNFSEESVLIHQNNISPRLLGNWLGINLYMGNIFPWKSEENVDNFHDTQKNITNSALSFANQIGIKQKIIFGYNLNQREINQSSKLTIDSDTIIITSSQTDMEDNIISSLKKVIVPKETIGISKFLEKQFKNNLKTDRKKAHYSNAIQEFKKAQFKIEQIKNLTNEILNHGKTLILEADKSPVAHNIFEITQLEKQIDSADLSEMSTLSKLFVPELSLEKNLVWDTKDNIKLSISYYQRLMSGILELSRHIETAIIQTEVRLLEIGELTIDNALVEKHLKSFKNSTIQDKSIITDRNIFKYRISDLKTYYNNDKKEGMLPTLLYLVFYQNALKHQPGRINILEQFKPEFYTINDNITIAELTVKNLKNKHKVWYHSELDTSNSLKLDGLEIKLYNLFTLEDKKGIKKIINGMNLISDKSTEWQALFHLAQGYQHELNNHAEEAIDEYGYANSEQTIESALKRLVFITLNKGKLDYARDILQVLSDISPIYLTQLAELYLITKNYKEALDTYAQYLDYNASDIEVLLKMGLLYKSQDIIDGAQFIFSRVIELEPHNKIAHDNLEKLSTH